MHGTAAELYNLMLREMSSVGAPSWMSCRLQERATNIFLFTLDQGPDNQGCMKFIKELLVGKPHTMMMITWCMMHQCQLNVKAALAILDKG